MSVAARLLQALSGGCRPVCGAKRFFRGWARRAPQRKSWFGGELWPAKRVDYRMRPVRIGAAPIIGVERRGARVAAPSFIS